MSNRNSRLANLMAAWASGTRVMTDDDARLLTRTAVQESAQHLCEEFAGLHAPDDVIRQTYRTRESLLSQGIRAGLVPAVEEATRHRLRHALMTTPNG